MTSSTLETDAFGNTWSPGTTGTQTPFGFAGQHGYQSDADSGLARLGHRYYDASTGRFLSRDPIQDGRNWYVYCGSDPVNTIDPEGLTGGDANNKDKGKKHYIIVAIDEGWTFKPSPDGNGGKLTPDDGKGKPIPVQDVIVDDGKGGKSKHEKNWIVGIGDGKWNVPGLDAEAGWDGNNWWHGNDSGGIVFNPDGSTQTPGENVRYDPDLSHWGSYVRKDGPGKYLGPKYRDFCYFGAA